MNRRTSMVIVAATLGVSCAIAEGHYSERVWADVDVNGQIRTQAGPPGGAGPYAASQFFYSRVFARDLGDQTDVTYTSLLGGPLDTDSDFDDDGVNYASNFPGYEATPFPTTGMSGTFSLSFASQPLYYIPASGNTPGHFEAVASAFAGQTLPHFSISNVVVDSSGNNVVQSTDSDGSGDPSVGAFSVGSHGHPEIILHPNPGDNGDDDTVDSDQYDGVYALGLTLSRPGIASSDTYYLVLGKNAALSEIAQAGIVAETALATPISTRWNSTTGGSWNAGGNWSGGIPFYTGDTVTFGSVPGLSAPGTITLDGSHSAGHLVFNSTSSYTIAQGSGGGWLTIGAADSADITVLAGSHTISAPMAFAAGLTVNTSGGTGLTISGALTMPVGSTLTKAGGGTLTISGPITAGASTGAGSAPPTVTTSSLSATGGITIFYTDPTANLALSAGGVGTQMNFTAAVSGGFLSRTAASVAVNDGGKIALLHAANLSNRMVLVTGGLTFGGATVGQMDLSNNALIVHNGDRTALEAVIRTGRNANGNGSWTGPGIVSSAAAGSSSPAMTVGIATGAEVKGLGGSSTALWCGQTVHATDTLAMYTYAGDANLDGRIDADDYFQIDSHLGTGKVADYFSGDFNFDGHINGDDYFLIDSNFNDQTLGQIANSAGIAGVGAVPEPASIGMAGIVAVELLRRRKRRG